MNQPAKKQPDQVEQEEIEINTDIDPFEVR